MVEEKLSVLKPATLQNTLLISVVRPVKGPFRPVAPIDALVTVSVSALDT